MSLSDELVAEVSKIFLDQWSTRDGEKVPESEDVQLGNDAVKLDGTVLYADISGSTRLVDSSKAHFAAEIYKTFLHCAARIVRNEGGTITAYDGDRIMAVFIGGSKNTNAARAALRINWARVKVINPAIKAQYKNTAFELQQVTGVDTSSLFVARTGVRGANDLVWVGRAANHAAKLTELSSDFPSRITQDVYDHMNDKSKSSNGKPMWEKITWSTTGRTIYRSTWLWAS